jgi:hypothetical protein
MNTLAPGSLLAQSRPANTTAATAFTATQNTEIVRIVVCNTTGSATTYGLYHDNDGSTYDQTTALRYAKAIAANDVDEITCNPGAGYSIAKNGTLGVQTGTASALTFSIYGYTGAVR